VLALAALPRRHAFPPCRCRHIEVIIRVYSVDFCHSDGVYKKRAVAVTSQGGATFTKLSSFGQAAKNVKEQFMLMKKQSCVRVGERSEVLLTRVHVRAVVVV